MIESYKIGANKDLWSASRQCKEWLKEEFNTQAPFREVIQELDYRHSCANFEKWVHFQRDSMYSLSFSMRRNVTKCGVQGLMAMIIQMVRHFQTELLVQRTKYASIWNVWMPINDDGSAFGYTVILLIFFKFIYLLVMGFSVNTHIFHIARFDLYETVFF